MQIGIHQDGGRPLIADDLQLCVSGGKLFAALDITEHTGQKLTFFFHDAAQCRAIGEQFIKLADMYAARLKETDPHPEATKAFDDLQKSMASL